jgi:histidinol dehydrogenase
LIIADSSANPVHVAADMLAQAEHDPLAAAILITPDSYLAQRVAVEVSHQLQGHPRQTLTEKAIAHYGVAIVVDSLATAVQLSNQFAPEHLELEVDEPWDLLEQVRHAGAIFLGHATPRSGWAIIWRGRTIPCRPLGQRATPQPSARKPS